ncbi:MAG: DUF3524 domain-containing protein [Spirochaetales bacterium]|nr:DUF3524 domain-containing protein [Spirochaetales bacterium]
MKPLKILFLESFYSGSHKAFADGLVKNSKYKIDLLTMPARFWKWRMKGAALYFSEQVKNIEDYELIFTTDLINISDLKSFFGSSCPPVVLYFHENQLAYPLNKGEKLDYHYGLTDLTNALGAKMVVFNSHTHMNTFLRELPLFIGHMPDSVPNWSINRIRLKSLVLYPGIDDSALKRADENNGVNPYPVIIWNHRWEYDKNPEEFFNVLFNLKKDGIKFQLALLGERYKKYPPVFRKAIEILRDEIIHTGYLENYDEYINLLKRGNIVISTSNQENYGIAVIEATLAGCRPLLPNRLSYPEIIPKEFHSECLFSDDYDLEKRLKRTLTGDKAFKQNVLIDRMSKLCWNTIIKDYDKLFDELVNGEK